MMIFFGNKNIKVSLPEGFNHKNAYIGYHNNHIKYINFI